MRENKLLYRLKKIVESPWFPFLGVFLLWGTFWAISSCVYPEMECRGQLGDSFGVVSSLFAGLAFAGAIWTIRQLLLQNRILRNQNFENTFFQLLSQHREMIDSMVIPGSTLSSSKQDLGSRNYAGRECFDRMLSKLRDDYPASEEEFFATMQSDDPDEAIRLMREEIKTRYGDFFSKLQPYIGHHFWHLFGIIEFVGQRLCEDTEKRFYYDLILAQLSSMELGLLFYHGLSDHGSEFVTLIEQSSLFRNISDDVLMRAEHKRLYDEKAYSPD